VAAQTFASGPYYGVLDTVDPYDDPAQPTKLQDTLNCYVADPIGGSGMYARPGFFRAAPVLTTSGIGQACAEWTHTMLSGTVYRFVAVNGKLYRLSGTSFATATDVTPVGVAIDNGTTPTSRFYMRSFADQLMFTDGVHRPWRGTNLGATPITGTYIDIDGSGTAWTSTAPPAEYNGTLWWIVTTGGSGAVVPGVCAVWCEPNQPDVGYVQSGYADFWNLIQQTGQQIGAMTLKALAADNNNLYYFRDYSIGAVAGTPGLSMSSTATRDLVSQNVGCTAPGSIVQFGDNIFFVDTIGRPWMMTNGGRPKAIWQQLRGQIANNPSYIANPTATALVGVGAVVPQLNAVAISGWSSNPTGSVAGGPLPPTTLYLFDQQSGSYMGRWQGASTLSTFDALAVMKDVNNAPTFTVMSLDSGLGSGLWLQNLLSANPTNGPWVDQWADFTHMAVPTIQAKSQRSGFNATVDYNWLEARAVTGSAAAVQLTTTTPYATVTQSTVTPPTSNDSTYRCRWDLDGQTRGREMQLTLSPTTAASQWVLYRIEVDAEPEDVQPETP
jgi:hypothetical protein